jgi:hypothetical protein
MPYATTPPTMEAHTGATIRPRGDQQQSQPKILAARGAGKVQTRCSWTGLFFIGLRT